MKIWIYEGCSTCRKALAYLKSTGRPFEALPIRETPPSLSELKAMLKVYKGDLKALFNTSGRDYRALGLSKKLAKMSPAAALAMMRKNGNLVKRPFLLAGNTGMVGFDVEEWKEKGIR